MSDPSPEHADAGRVELPVEPNVFCYDAVVRAAHLFTDTCHVQIAEEHGKPVVCISPKSPETDVERIIKEFYNELLDQQLRIRLREETGEIQKMIIAEAFAPLDHPEKEQQV